MACVWLRARCEMRARWGTTIVLVLLIALVGSIAMAAAIGARRTATVPERLLEAIDGRIDLQILDLGPVDHAAIEALPMVERTSLQRFLVSDTELDLVTSTDQLFQAQLIDGELDPDDPHAAVVDSVTARAFDLEVGDEVELAFYSQAQWEAQDPSGGPQGAQATARVAGIMREPDDIDAADPAVAAALGSEASFLLPVSFLDRYGTEVGLFTNRFLSVQLRGGPDDVPAFKAAVRRLPAGAGVQFLDTSDTQNQDATGRAVSLQAVGLLLVAIAAGLAGTATVGQLLVRHLRADATDAPTLGALGMTRGQRARVGLVRGAVIGTAGALLAVVGAVAWSGLTPVGLARDGEPDPGSEVNVALLLAGGVTLAVLVTATSVVIASRRNDARRDGDATEAAARGGSWGRAVRTRLGAIPATALSLAFGARTARLATRATVLALAMAIAAVSGGVVLLASLDGVTSRPDHFGWTFDASAGEPFEEDPTNLYDLVEQTPGVEAVAKATQVTVEMEGRSTAVVAIEAGAGIDVVTIDGRPPTADDEIALGRTTLADLDRSIGDTVSVDAGNGPVDLTISGTAVVPELGGTGTGIGDGGVLTLAALQSVAPDIQPNLALLRFVPGQGQRSLGVFRELSQDVQGIVEPFMPASLYQLVRIRSLPAIVAALLVVLALATLVQSILGSGRVRRRELAVLKVLGFTRRQVAASAVWQAVGFVAVALVIGLTIGVAAGRLGWDVIARRLGLPDDPTVPLALPLLMVPSALLVAVAVAILPGWWAARRGAAAGLRME